MAWHKCRYQLEPCQNWTNDDLTHGTNRAHPGPPGPNGLSTLIDYPAPICQACLDMQPNPQ